jgi:PAS domain S-box-containing protein
MISAIAALTGSYDYNEVARSVLIAIVASYAALDLTGRVTAARGRVRLAWLSGGAIAMGIGTWAMHFNGMLAFCLPVPVEYHWPTTLAAFLVAILTSAVALYGASRQKMGLVEALTGSIVMGAGIAGTHFIGMAAMRVPAIMHFSRHLVALSILLAILFSLIALLMAFDLREETRWSVPRRLGSATVMGVAVSAMHYTGMAAASFIPASPADLSHAVTISPLANNGIATVTLVVIVAAITTSSVDRRRNEGRLRLVIDTAPAMLHSARPDGYVDFFNKRWLEYLGVSLDDLLGWRWTSVVYPADVAQLVDRWQTSVASGRPFQAEARLRRADGEYRLTLHRKVPLRDETGNIVKWYGSVIDIEDRRRAEEEVKSSEERYRVIVEAASDAVISMDESGGILLANPATARIFGYDPVELIGEPLTILMPEFMRKLHEAGFRRYLATGERHLNWQGAEVTALRKNGQEFPVEVSFGEMTSNGHKVFTGFIRDISEKKRAEEQLRQAQEDLARVTRVVAMGELAAAIAHEVNQPLTAIVTNGNFCLRTLGSATSNPDELRAAIREIVNDGTRASAVISRILGLLTKEAPNRTELDINQVIKDVTILLRNEFTRNRVSLRTELPSDLPRITGDPVQLQQVLINLIMNAIEAARTSTSGRREILIRSAKNPHDVLVQVQDSGPGIKPELAHRIFEPFFTTKAKGIGMGLSISHSIIESHGGCLDIAPSSTGALFEFTLPID